MQNKHQYLVYILKCSDNTFYTGVTNDLDRRLLEHSTGENKDSYTYSRRPVTLVYYELYYDINEAIEREKQVKNWSQAKKKALIEGNSEKLEYFSLRKSDRDEGCCSREPRTDNPQPRTDN